VKQPKTKITTMGRDVATYFQERDLVVCSDLNPIN
jgi:hypothetical protein